MAPLVWLVTGATSGIGAALVDHIIARGDKVIASGRNVEKRLGHLHAENVALLELDITADLEQLRAQIQGAWEIFGHIDVLVNNAGISAMKSAEEADAAFIDNMFQANLFGHMRITQAILPLLRAQGHGTLAFTSSSALWGTLPFLSHYAASKAALSTYIESLHKEVRPLGIRCVAFECGAFPTNLGQPRDTDPSQAGGFGSNGPAIEAYQPLFGSVMNMFASDMAAHMPGDVSKAAARIVDVVKQEGVASGKAWAVRIALGTDGMGSARQRCQEQLDLIDVWKDVSSSTDQDGADGTVANRRMFKYTTVIETPE